MMRVLPPEKTFEDFILKHGGELVSDFIPNIKPPENADYLFRSPLIIAELKVVKRDAFTERDKDKLDHLLESWMQEGIIPNFSGRIDVGLRELPSSCQRQWLRIHEVPWKRRLAKANNQIKSIKSVLHFPDACGVLFIADDAAHSFGPELVMTCIARVLRSEKKDHAQIYSSIDRIVYFSVNPRTVTRDGRGLNFWLPTYRSRENSEIISKFLGNLGQNWIQYHADLLSLKLVPGIV
jgi:hypothetical protein